MDAGLAAVCGALAGSVATIGAALATGWSQREGARITARAEHRRQRREPRYGIYKDFVHAVTRLKDHTEPFFGLHGEPLATGFREETSDLVNAVRKCWIDVALSGPRDVQLVASEIDEACQGIGLWIRFYDVLAGQYDSPQERLRAGRVRAAIEGINTDFSKMNESFSRFLHLAQDALEDDGTIRKLV